MDWLYDIEYRPVVKIYKCTINALSPQPDVINQFTLIQPVVSRALGFIISLSISVTWERPSINGQFTFYELYLTPVLISSPAEKRQNHPFDEIQNVMTAIINN